MVRLDHDHGIRAMATSNQPEETEVHWDQGRIKGGLSPHQPNSRLCGLFPGGPIFRVVSP